MEPIKRGIAGELHTHANDDKGNYGFAIDLTPELSITGTARSEEDRKALIQHVVEELGIVLTSEFMY